MEDSSRVLRWGIIGTGRIAGKFAAALRETGSGELFAVASRSKASAEKFGDEYEIPRRYASYEALLEDSDVDVIYIAVPHPMHVKWTILCAEAGKHILCEKPLALNTADASAAVDAAAKNGVFLMEAFMYRCHPQTKKIVEIVKSGALGEVLTIRASFAFRAGFNPESRLFNNSLGGGGILDVGCYPVSFSRLVAGAVLGSKVAEPVELHAVGHVGEALIDEWSSAVMRFPGDIIAELSTGVSIDRENDAVIYGTEGRLRIPQPWQPGRGGEKPVIYLHHESEVEEISVEHSKDLYAYEAEVAADAIKSGRLEADAMSWADTLGNMAVLDKWRTDLGVVYESEKPENYTLTAAGRPLEKHSKTRMKYSRLPGVEKEISRLVMGGDNQRTFPQSAVMFDHYFELGGNCFDTAYIYGGGLPERLLGQWLETRGVREETVIICKGAHTPECRPEAVRRQLEESLDRLRIDYADIYFLHRDNPEIPAGEFIDALNEVLEAGLVKAFGGSNWTAQRVDEANAYAAEHGRVGVLAVSNNFSLARMMEPVWAGCVSSSEPGNKAWHERTGMPLFPWSSQARGFFVPGRAAPDKKDDAELARCWYSEDNFERRRRAFDLAKRKGVEPVAVALAYVLNQPFPVFALIGPRAPSETRSSMNALALELTEKEMLWLNLED